MIKKLMIITVICVLIFNGCASRNEENDDMNSNEQENTANGKALTQTEVTGIVYGVMDGQTATPTNFFIATSEGKHYKVSVEANDNTADGNTDNTNDSSNNGDTGNGPTNDNTGETNNNDTTKPHTDPNMNNKGSVPDGNANGNGANGAGNTNPNTDSNGRMNTNGTDGLFSTTNVNTDDTGTNRDVNGTNTPEGESQNGTNDTRMNGNEQISLGDTVTINIKSGYDFEDKIGEITTSSYTIKKPFEGTEEVYDIYTITPIQTNKLEALFTTTNWFYKNFSSFNDGKNFLKTYELEDVYNNFIDIEGGEELAKDYFETHNVYLFVVKGSAADNTEKLVFRDNDILYLKLTDENLLANPTSNVTDTSDNDSKSGEENKDGSGNTNENESDTGTASDKGNFTAFLIALDKNMTIENGIILFESSVQQ